PPPARRDVDPRGQKHAGAEARDRQAHRGRLPRAARRREPRAAPRAPAATGKPPRHALRAVPLVVQRWAVGSVCADIEAILQRPSTLRRDRPTALTAESRRRATDSSGP